MKVKAGYRTSEFWFTLVSFIFSGLFLTGIIKENEHKEELIAAVSHAVESTILISGQVLILYKYIKGRNEVKKIVRLEEQQPQPEPEEIANNDSKRTNPRTSRKTKSRTKTVAKKSKKRSSK